MQFWASVPDTLLKLRVPEQCKFCEAKGTLQAETIVVGNTVTLKWCCRKCDAEWSIMSGEFVERRKTPERRRTPRNERRKR